MDEEIQESPKILAMNYVGLLEELDRVRELNVRVRLQLLDVVLELVNRHRHRGGTQDRFLRRVERMVRDAVGLTGQIFVVGQR